MITSAAVFLSGLVFSAWYSTPLAPQFVGESVRRVETHEKVVALTYDDGPNPFGTQAVLDLLARRNVHATFFLVGNRVQQYPELAQKIWQAGHQVGNHSWSHSLLMFKTYATVWQEVEKTDLLLRQLGYTDEIYFRSPHGMKFISLPRVLNTMHKKNILFDVVAWDWRSPGAPKIARKVLHEVRPGSIILLHDGVGKQSDTLKAVDHIITTLKDRGFKFVTVAELLTYEHKTTKA